jgi:hypothetical protein
MIFVHIDAVGLSWHNLKTGVTVERGHSIHSYYQAMYSYSVLRHQH